MFKLVRYLLIFLVFAILISSTTIALAGYQTPDPGPTPTPVILQVSVESISGTQKRSTLIDLIEPFMVGLLAIFGTIVGAFLGAYYERRAQDQRWRRDQRQKRYQGLEILLVEIGKIAHHARFLSLDLPQANQLEKLGEQIAELQTSIRGMEFSDAYARVTDRQLISYLDDIELGILALPLTPTSLDETQQLLRVLTEQLNVARRRLDAVIIEGESEKTQGTTDR